MLRAFGDELFAEQHGDGPARVLALPGWMRTRADFRTVLDGYDALAVDLPGFGGASPAPAAAMGAAGYARAVEPVLDGCAERIVVLGHSYGGRVAVNLAVLRPERVGGLVLTGVPRLLPPDRVPSPSRRYRALRWLHRQGLVSDARMEAMRKRTGSDDYRAASGVMRDTLVIAVNENYAELLDRIECAVELVWGDDDAAAPLAVAEQAAARFAGPATLTVVPAAGHLTPLTAPHALRDALDRRLADLPA